MRKVLCIGTRDICRSPMMKVLLLSKLKYLDFGADVESAGILKEAEGQNACQYSVDEMRNRGLDIGAHKSRHIGSVGDLRLFDLILCTGRHEAGKTIALCHAIRDRVEIINESIGGIPNPWKKEPDVFRTCAFTIELMMASMAERLILDWN